MIHRPEVSAKYHRASACPDTQKPRACDLPRLGDDLVSEGGTETVTPSPVLCAVGACSRGDHNRTYMLVGRCRGCLSSYGWSGSDGAIQLFVSQARSASRRWRVRRSRSKSASVLVSTRVYGRPCRLVWWWTGSSAASIRAWTCARFACASGHSRVRRLGSRRKSQSVPHSTHVHPAGGSIDQSLDARCGRASDVRICSAQSAASSSKQGLCPAAPAGRVSAARRAAVTSRMIWSPGPCPSLTASSSTAADPVSDAAVRMLANGWPSESADSLGQPLPVGERDRAEPGDEGLALRASRADHAGAACDCQLDGDASDAACSTVYQQQRTQRSRDWQPERVRICRLS
jgi:hypothetical protein